MSGHHDSAVTQSSLLSRARRKDPAAWRSLVDLYRPLLIHWCRQSGLPPASIADCVQDTFIAVARHLDDFQPQRAEGSFRAWLWTITRNKVNDHFRRQPAALAAGGSTAHAQLGNLVDPMTVPSDEPTSAQALDDLVSRGLSQVRLQFSSKHWKIFERLVIDGLTTQQVADDFQKSPAAIRQIRSRILRTLRQQLGDLPD